MWPDLPPRPDAPTRDASIPKGIGFVWACRYRPLAWSETPARSLREAIASHDRQCNPCPGRSRKPTEEDLRRRNEVSGTAPRVPLVPYVLPLVEGRHCAWGLPQVENPDEVDGMPDAKREALYLMQRVLRAVTWLRDAAQRARSRARVLEIVGSTLRVEWDVRVEVVSERQAARRARWGRLVPWPSPHRLLVLSPNPTAVTEYLTDLTGEVYKHVRGLDRMGSLFGPAWSARLVRYAAAEVVLGVGPHTPAWWGLVAGAGGFYPMGVEAGARRLVLLDAELDR